MDVVKEVITSLCVKVNHSLDILGTIHSDMDAISAEGIPWTTYITLNNRNFEFKIETGANVTIIPEADYRKHQGG